MALDLAPQNFFFPKIPVFHEHLWMTSFKVEAQKSSERESFMSIKHVRRQIYIQVLMSKASILYKPKVLCQ